MAPARLGEGLHRAGARHRAIDLPPLWLRARRGDWDGCGDRAGNRLRSLHGVDRAQLCVEPPRGGGGADAVLLRAQVLMTRPRVSPPALAALLLSSAVCLAEAQQLQSTWQVPQTVAADESAPRHGAAAPFLSVILPGAGQYRLGQTRWIAYAALEAAGWLWFRDRRASGLDFEARYRDLAWDVARTGTTGVRRDGDFHDYEALARYERSGAFDADATRAGVQPETDPSTYNGALWALARAMFFPAGADSLPVDSPEYARALEYYVERAVAAEF